MIDLPRICWLPILYGPILTFRPKHSAAMYRQIWDDARGGSPLLYYTRAQAQALGQQLPEYDVRLAMSYTEPTIDQVLADFGKDGIRDITILPMYPQFSVTTTGSIYDAVTQHYYQKAPIPTFRIVTDYHDDPRYIQILANTIQSKLDAAPETEMLLFSYHGIPQRYVTDKKDPYWDQCHVTTEMVMERLDHCVPYETTFQSKFGPGTWLQPATNARIAALPAEGAQNVAVVTPSFTADCLETLYEIDQEYRTLFTKKGGNDFTFIPPLNAQPEYIQFLAQLVKENSTAKR